MSGRLRSKKRDRENAIRACLGGIVLDFEDSTLRLLSEEHNSENADNSRLKGPRYSCDYTYECLFRQSGSVATQGESSRSNLVGGEQLCSMANSIQPFGYGIRDRPLSFVGRCYVDDHYSIRCAANKGPIILDFENSTLNLASASDVPCS
ncbi:hypothetical protein Tco_0195596, partial [Tanacetum coccineum]